MNLEQLKRKKEKIAIEKIKVEFFLNQLIGKVAILDEIIDEEEKLLKEKKEKT